MTQELQKKVDRAIKLIQSASKIATEHGQPLEVAYSGGKDSDVILELTKRLTFLIAPSTRTQPLTQLVRLSTHRIWVQRL